MDFYNIIETYRKDGSVEISPIFKVLESKDLIIKGKEFYAIWDEEQNMWSTSIYSVQRIIDKALWEYSNQLPNHLDKSVQTLSNFSTRKWTEILKYMSTLPSSEIELNSSLVFKSDITTKETYSSKRLSYDPVEGPIEAYNELFNTLYSPEELDKIEWSIGAILTGASKHIHKFTVLYGEGGSGKSTVIDLIQTLFDGYYAVFDAKSLAKDNQQFATSVFKYNPLVAIQHDGDLSKIEDNTKLNSITAHELMNVNEKNKPLYTMKFNAFLFMGTNKPVKITDSKSGIIRRLIDVRPTRQLVEVNRYDLLKEKIYEFEIPHIAYHCIQKFKSMGKNYYNGYRPISMMQQTDVFYNFIETHFDTFNYNNGCTLTQAYELYKIYCDEAGLQYKMARHIFKEELKSYFDSFHDVTRIEGKQIRSYYSGFKHEKFANLETEIAEEIIVDNGIKLEHTKSTLDDILEDCKAQYAVDNIPKYKWDNVKYTLKNINTSKTHYVKPPENHIVIDFDIKDANGVKSKELNRQEAAKWPKTYAEYSNGGNGIHLHYIYDGDPNQLKPEYAKDIEIKRFTGGSSLRRKVSFCNNLPIIKITNLPVKGGEKMLVKKDIANEEHLRKLIVKNLHKQIHGNTICSVDFIKKLLDDMYESGQDYDVSDMQNAIITFAASSTNQANKALALVTKMKFKSKEDEPAYHLDKHADIDINDLYFFDIEVKPNLLLVVVEKMNEETPIVLRNPTPEQIEPLLNLPLVGYNNRGYDNHILYAGWLGFSNYDIYKISKSIISKEEKSQTFAKAFNLSHADIYDFCTTKQTLKKWEIELGLPYQELDEDWDADLVEEDYPKMLEYCINDVRASKEVFKKNIGDYRARQILHKLTGEPINASTGKHAQRLIFGNDSVNVVHAHFNNPDLTKEFPEYKFEYGVSTFKGEPVGEGGAVRAIPGLYGPTDCWDGVSLHPSTIIALNLFGKYTINFKNMVDLRVIIKKMAGLVYKRDNGEIIDVSLLYNLKKQALDIYPGKLDNILQDETLYNVLQYALKIVINSIYGLTTATFDNIFKHPDNKDNKVAKRGALFMLTLWDYLKSLGYNVFHLKTDSVKIENPDSNLGKIINDFAKPYGYIFEMEDAFDKIALVNKAVYIGLDKVTKHWHAKGTEYAHPIVFKNLFSKEEIMLTDYIESKSCKTALYLQKEDQNLFCGKSNEFYCVLEPYGYSLMRTKKDDKQAYDSVSKTKGYYWITRELFDSLNYTEKNLDMSYYQKLITDAVNHIAEYGNPETFIPQC